jgi:hypothetical protein
MLADKHPEWAPFLEPHLSKGQPASRSVPEIRTVMDQENENWKPYPNIAFVFPRGNTHEG